MAERTKKGARKQQIAEKATDLFRKKGYAATSMRDLAQAMGIEAASLYSHIRSKEELLQGICFRMAEAFYTAQQAVADETAPILTQLENAVVAHVGVITEDVAASAVFFNEWRHLSAEKLAEFKKLRRDYEASFRELMEEGVAAGELRGVDTNFTTLTLFSAMNVIYTWYRPGGERTAEQVGQDLARLLIYGLKKH